MYERGESIFNVLPNKEKLSKLKKISLEDFDFRNVCSTKKQKEFLDYIIILINNYNNNIYNIEEYGELKLLFLRLSGEFLLDYKDYILKVMNMDKNEQKDIIKHAESVYSFRNINEKTIPSKMLNIVFEIMKEHKMITKKSVSGIKKLMCHEIAIDVDYDTKVKIIEENIGIIEYLISDIIEDNDNFYRDSINEELDKRCLKLTEIPMFDELVELLKKDTIKSIINMLEYEKLSLKNDLIKLRNEPIFGYQKKINKRKENIKSIYNAR